MQKYITYEQFGAAGDGRANDLPAIARAHEEANRLQLPVKAREGAVYYLAPQAITARVQTCVDWTGAAFVIDDVDCENLNAPVFHVCSAREPLPLAARAMRCGQLSLPNPHGCDLFVVVENENHRDYIRKGLNQDEGHTRTDVFVLGADSRLCSPLSFDFEQITRLTAYPIDDELLTLTGGSFTTIANRAESKYNYHARNILITRSHTEVCGLTHLITGEGEHGAPYNGFVRLLDCARSHIHDCTFTGHRIYETIGSAGLPVPMGSYDIRLDRTAQVRIARCRQTTDIHDSRFWGLIATNFCRDLVFEDCAFSRFDAHMGVTNCTLRRCRLGWQCLNAIGNGTFLIEETEAHGNAFVNLRGDYGCTWRGIIRIKNSTWLPRGSGRAVFHADNDGTHFFGYPCHLPEVDIDGLKVLESAADDGPLYIFNNYLGREAAPEAERPHMPIPPAQVRVRGIDSPRRPLLCEEPALMAGTVFTVG